MWNQNVTILFFKCNCMTHVSRRPSAYVSVPESIFWNKCWKRILDTPLNVSQRVRHVHMCIVWCKLNIVGVMVCWSWDVGILFLFGKSDYNTHNSYALGTNIIYCIDLYASCTDLYDKFNRINNFTYLIIYWNVFSQYYFGLYWIMTYNLM